MPATQANQVYDLVSWAKTRQANFDSAIIAELLNQSNEPVQDMVWLEGNLPTGHRITQRTGLPTTYTRQLNDYATSPLVSIAGSRNQWIGTLGLAYTF